MRRRHVIAALATASVGGLAGCGAPTDDQSPTTERRPPEAIRMVAEDSRFYFDPIGLAVDPGRTLTWENTGGRHSTTAYVEGVAGAPGTRIPDGADGWNSGVLDPGEKFQHTFDVEGTYDYFCRPHRAEGMVGRVVVGDPGGPAEGSDPSAGTLPLSSTIVDQGVVEKDEFVG